MENKLEEKNDNTKNKLFENSNDKLDKHDSISTDSELKNKNLFPSNFKNSEDTRYNSDNKSIQDKSDDLNQNIQSPLININQKNKIQKSKLDSLNLKFSTPQKNKKIPQKFHIFLERTENLHRRQKENLNELQKNVEENIKKLMKEKPDITERSRLIDKKNSKTKFLERIKEQQIKIKQRKEKLKEKINIERALKKEKIDKPLEFNKISKEDKKFMKVYEAMVERQKEVNDRFQIFNEVVHEYNMKECTFSPQINKQRNKSYDESNSNSENEEDKEEKLVKRLYDDEIKYRNKKKENLFKKYTPSFHPKINKNSDKLSRNWKSKLTNKHNTNYYIENKNNFNFDENANTERNNKSFSKRKIKKENIEYKND